VNSTFHISIRIACNRIMDGLLYLNIATFFKVILIFLVMILSAFKWRDINKHSVVCVFVQNTTLFASVRGFCGFIRGINEYVVFQ
jgi:hypothetical protein